MTVSDSCYCYSVTVQTFTDVSISIKYISIPRFCKKRFFFKINDICIIIITYQSYLADCWFDLSDLVMLLSILA